LKFKKQVRLQLIVFLRDNLLCCYDCLSAAAAANEVAVAGHHRQRRDMRRESFLYLRALVVGDCSLIGSIMVF
jgi:hypothetical protein